MIWTIDNLLTALVGVSAIWLFATLAFQFPKFRFANIRQISIDDHLMKTLVPILSLVVSIFAFESSNATAELQSNLQMQMAEFRGELRFRATYDDDWTLKLERLDREAFSIKNITLTPSYQRSPAIGPEIGKPVRFDPLADYSSDGRTIVIRNAREKACENESSGEVVLKNRTGS